MNLVNLESVSHAYGPKPLLSGVSLGIAAGDRIGVVGRNGGGKTTLISLIAGMLTPDGGRVTHNRGLRVGVLSQGDDLDPDRSIEQVVLGDRAEHEWASEAQIREILDNLVEGGELAAKVAKAAYDALVARERMGSTGIGNGIAIPHVKMKGAPDETLVAIARSEAGVEFASIDGDKVRVIFLVLSQDEHPEDHLAILKSQEKDPTYQKDKFLLSTGYMSEFTTFVPNHPKFGSYDEVIFRLLSAVEAGQMQPKQAVDVAVGELQAQLKDDLIVK